MSAYPTLTKITFKKKNYIFQKKITFFKKIITFKNKIHKKKKLKKFNWVSGSPPMLYTLVLGPTPILHTNVHENPLTFGILINLNDNWVVGHHKNIFSVHFMTMSPYPHIFQKIKFFKKNKFKKINW